MTTAARPGDPARPLDADLLIIGAGAAGLMAAIWAGRTTPGMRIVAIDGAKKLGAKILVAGGGRCNVTNATVSEVDFWGGNRNVIKRVLRAFPVAETVRFFAELGVPLHEEEYGKLFPDSNQARTVLDALLAEATRRGVVLRTGCRALAVRRTADGFSVTVAESAGSADSHGVALASAKLRDLEGAPADAPELREVSLTGRTDERPGAAGLPSRREILCRRLVLATGGLSLPKTGSDGGGYALAESLGHTLTPRFPGLAPLVLDGEFHPPLSGVSHEVELHIRVAGRTLGRLRGPLLWTHFGISGPAALNASRHWHAARVAGQAVEMVANLLPGETLETAEQWLLRSAADHPRAAVQTVLAQRLPARVAEACLADLGISGSTQLAQLAREARRRLLSSMLAWPLRVRDSRGFGYAEVTAGGVPLEEIDPASMESRRCRGLYLVGEILDADGRLGGFNFQWAWSTGKVAGAANGAEFRVKNEE